MWLQKDSPFTSNESLSVTKERMQGYLNALTYYNIPVNENLIMYLEVQQDRAKAGIDYLMCLREKPDAIFAINNPVAVGCILDSRINITRPRHPVMVHPYP